MDYPEFQRKIAQIKRMGYVQSHRRGDTGIGKTLEDLLGITENNIAGPDFATYELKSGRKDSVSMLTLFTKTPMPQNAINRLLETFGYPQRTARYRPRFSLAEYASGKPQVGIRRDETDSSTVPTREKELHVTVDAVKPNSVGLMLEIKHNKIYIGNKRGVEAYWDNNTLRTAFEKKYRRLIYVLAEHKKEAGKEYFWFNEANLLENFSFERFSGLVAQGTVKADLRIGHYPDGRPHDHGTGFRVLPRYLPECFDKIVKIV
jgi:hypothetical protein